MSSSITIKPYLSTREKLCKSFDYTSVDAETSEFIQQQTTEIRVLMKRTAQGIVEIGQKLIEVKKRLEHGRFLEWLEAEFDWHRGTANKFMQVALHFGSLGMSKFSTIAPSALYVLAAPSTPAVAREEALARAQAGEFITYAEAKAIKQKYTPLRQKPKPEREPSQLQPRDATRVVQVPQAAMLAVPKQSRNIDAPKQRGSWWRLERRHLLYCGEPNSPEILGRITEEVSLLLAFPPTFEWKSQIRARTAISLTTQGFVGATSGTVDRETRLSRPRRLKFLEQAQCSHHGNNLKMFEDMVEQMLLLYSNIGDLVVTCFLPLPEILSIFNRLERRSLLAEPDQRQCNEVILEWKRSGLIVERIS